MNMGECIPGNFQKLYHNQNKTKHRKKCADIHKSNDLMMSIDKADRGAALYTSQVGSSYRLHPLEYALGFVMHCCDMFRLMFTGFI